MALSSPLPPRAARRALVAAGVAAACSLAGCVADELPRGLHATAIDGAVFGPTVVFDPLHRPDPEVPFPNDLAIAVSADGGKHISFGRDAPTAFERRLRHHVNEVPGFSAMSPISVAFDGPLDLATVGDDSVLVINVEPGSARLGEVVPVDLGRGYFPHRAAPTSYFPHDPLAQYDSFVLPPDNKVDSDGDGTPDQWVYHYETSTHTLDIRPLLPLEAGSRYAVVLTRAIQGFSKDGQPGQIRSPFPFVNHDSQTPALQRALPALQARGLGAADVAFAWTFTTGDLSKTFRALREGLYGRGKFKWLEAKFPPRITRIYNMDVGFDGLSDDMPGAHPGKKKFPYAERDHDRILQGPFMDGIFKIIAQFEPSVGGEFKHVSHAVFGDMTTVNLRAPKQTATTERNVWQIDLEQGTAVVDEEEVPFMITVPKTTEHHKPPFPVVVYAHATGTSRIEALLLADRFARAGIATFTIDAVGHGPVLSNAADLIVGFFKGDEGAAKSIVKALLGAYVFTDADTRFPDDMPLGEMIAKIEANGFMQQLLVKGRGTDDNGDCVLNDSPGEAYYAPNTIRLRDAMRQTTLDYIVAVRMLRSLGENMPAAIADPRAAADERILQNMFAGDFDADGVADIGGKDVPYFMMGISLGGIHTALTAPLEPYIVAATPVVAGAGIADIFIRTKLHNVIEKLMWKASGPMLIGCPGHGDAATTKEGDPNVRLSWNNDSDHCKRELKKSYMAASGACLKSGVEAKVWHDELGIREGARLLLFNDTTGEHAEGVAGKDGRFAIALAADIGDELRLQVLGDDGRVLRQSKLVSPVEGAARPRNTPEFRKLVQLNSNVLEGADAITVAERMFLDPKGQASTNILLMLAVGDRTVNFAAGLALARAIGLFGPLKAYVDDAPWREWTKETIRRGIVDDSVAEKLAAGVITADQTVPPLLNPGRADSGFGNCRTVASGKGVSGVCLANVGGKHEYIAQVDKDDLHPPVAGYKPSYTEYHRNLIVSYFHSLGTKVIDDPCWGDWKCAKEKGLVEMWDQPIAAVK